LSERLHPGAADRRLGVSESTFEVPVVQFQLTRQELSQAAAFPQSALPGGQLANCDTTFGGGEVVNRYRRQGLVHPREARLRLGRRQKVRLPDPSGLVNGHLQAPPTEIDPAQRRSGQNLNSGVSTARKGPPGQKLCLIETEVVARHDRLRAQGPSPQVFVENASLEQL
jgi:hypothetical protein